MSGVNLKQKVIMVRKRDYNRLENEVLELRAIMKRGKDMIHGLEAENEQLRQALDRVVPPWDNHIPQWATRRHIIVRWMRDEPEQYVWDNIRYSDKRPEES